MTSKELRQSAVDCLGKAFNNDSSISSHVVQAAVSIVLTLEPPNEELIEARAERRAVAKSATTK